MTWLGAVLALVGIVAGALRTDQGSIPGQELIPLPGGGIALVRAIASLRIRSASGRWVSVLRLPLDGINICEADSQGILVVEMVEGEKYLEDGHLQVPYHDVVLLLGPDGKEIDRWEQPRLAVRSLASRGGRRWATLLIFGPMSPPPIYQLAELLPGGKINVVLNPLPPPPETGVATVPGPTFETRESPRLRLGPLGERVFCVPEECWHDGPCHKGFCYRNDQVKWSQFGSWTEDPIICGDYLVEPERWWYPWGEPGVHIRHDHHQIVMRRISDGVKVAAFRVQKNSAVACGSPGAVLVANTSITSVELSTGRQLWSVPTSSGRVVAIAQSGDCVTALANDGTTIDICHNGHSVSRQPSRARAKQ